MDSREAFLKIHASLPAWLPEPDRTRAAAQALVRVTRAAEQEAERERQRTAKQRFIEARRADIEARAASEGVTFEQAAELTCSEHARRDR